MKRFASLIAAAGAVATVSAFALAGGAGAASSLPALKLTLTGKSGVSISSSSIPSGAVSITATHSGKGGPGSFGIVRLNPNEPSSTAIAEGFSAVQKSHNNLDALTATGNFLVVSANAPGPVQTVLVPGNYIALNTSGNGGPAFAQFTVTKSSSPAALPAASSTQKAIEFGFRGSRVLKNHTTIRAKNGGYLVHMIDLLGVKSKADGRKAIAGLKAGKGQKFFHPLSNGVFISLLNPASPGAVQQQVLNAKPGYYVEACFMNTQDGREHTQLGMERLVRVKK
jgi:hypothetical protein